MGITLFCKVFCILSEIIYLLKWMLTCVILRVDCNNIDPELCSTALGCIILAQLSYYYLDVHLSY